MSMDDIGARRLMAGILKKACEDYAGDKGCPEWCSFKDSCKLNRIDAEHCDAKRFIHTAWCATLTWCWTVPTILQFATPSTALA